MLPSISVKKSVRPTARGRLGAILAERERLTKELTQDPILDLKTVSEALGGVSYGYIRQLLKRGDLKAFRIGRRGYWKVRQSALTDMLRKAEQSSGDANAL